MKTRFRNASLIVLIGILCIVLGEEVAAKTRKQRKAEIAEYIPVRYCELVCHPENYDCMKIVVHASYRYGYEWTEMYCVNCRDKGKTWVEFLEDDEEHSSYNRALRKLPHNQGTINATFYGIFYGSGGNYGHMNGYKFKFDVKIIKSIEIISRSGGVPAFLSKSEQKKLCQGNEIFVE